MTGLAQRFAAGPPATIQPRCTVTKLLGTLPETDAEALRVALADPAWTGSAIADALRAEGHKVSGQSVQRHRRRACECER